MKKKKPEQTNLFLESNVVSADEWKKSFGNSKDTKQKREQHEKKFMNSLGKALNNLGLVWIHLRNKCLNKFWHTCPHCKKKSLVTCYATLNEDYTGYPDILIVAAGIETKTT